MSQSKQLISIFVLVLLAVIMSAVLGFGAIREGIIAPPTGTVRLGPMTIMALPPCPSIPAVPPYWGRRCGSASPWALWVIVRFPNGEKQQWKIASMVIDP